MINKMNYLKISYGYLIYRFISLVSYILLGLNWVLSMLLNLNTILSEIIVKYAVLWTYPIFSNLDMLDQFPKVERLYNFYRSISRQ